MAINADTFRIRLEKIIQKEISSGFLDPETLNAHANTAQLEKLKLDFEVFQSTQRITDDIRPFIVFTRLMVTDGLLTLPSDFAYFSSLRFLDTSSLTEESEDEEEKEPCDNIAEECEDIDYANLPQGVIRIMDSDKVARRLSSKMMQPTITNPIGEFVSDGIRIYPTDITSAILVYLRYPATYNWGYTVNISNGLMVYDPGTSTDFEWNHNAFNELLVKTATYFGVYIREPELYQSAASLDQKGV